MADRRSSTLNWSGSVLRCWLHTDSAQPDWGPYFAPASSLARLNILRNITSVSLPVFVFCSEGW